MERGVKKSQCFLVVAIIFMMCLTICKWPVHAAAKVKLNKKQVTMWVDDTTQLKLKNCRKKITWKSNNKAVVTVNKKGKIIARGEGTTVIIAKVGNKKYRCKVTVWNTRLSDNSIVLSYGESHVLSLLHPKADIMWTSSDSRIANIENGIVYARAVGNATITAKCCGVEYSCDVTVTSGETADVIVDGIYTSKDKLASYIHLFGKLPSNFITKEQAQGLGWNGGSLNMCAPGKCIGGNVYTNYEKTLPVQDGRVYYECDVNTLGALQRGSERIVYSNDGLIFYTADHYGTFQQLY